MFRKALLALLIVTFAPLAADAAPLRFNLKPKDANSSAQGTFRIVDGKTTDELASFHVSVSGLLPSQPYCVRVKDGADKEAWSLSVFSDETGSISTKGNIRGAQAKQAMTGVEAEVDLSGIVILSGKAQ